MRSIAMRPPIELHMIDRASCFVNVIAELGYVWRRTNRPDVARISRAIGRLPGRPLPLPDAEQYLLQQGFTLQEVGSLG